MEEENKMDDGSEQNRRSESAFYGTSNEANQLPEDRGCNKAETTERVLPLPLKPQERFTVHSVSVNHTFRFEIPKKLVPPHKKTEVIELWVSRGKSPGIEFPLYAMHDPSSRKAIVSLSQVKTRQGERWKIGRISIYCLEEFVRTFNGNRPRGFEDFEIGMVDSHLEARIGGITVELSEYKLRTFRGEAILDLVVDGKPGLRIRKSKTRFTLQLLPDKERIASIRARKDALIVEYHTRKKSKLLATRVIELPRSNGRTLSIVPPALEIRLVSSPLTFVGNYLVQIHESFEKEVRDRIRLATSPGEYSKVRGEIGEIIINRILQMIGCPEIANHPTSKSHGHWSSEKKGPDSLRLVTTGGMGYFEKKWWKQIENAVSDGRKKVKAYCKTVPGPRGEKIGQGYIAVLDWKLGSLEARLYVEKVV